MQTATLSFGDQLRGWRQMRRMSQLDLALDADVSARHLSLVETGRAQPSRAMVLRLAERLDVPLRERNRLLLAAGLAPAYSERSLDDPDLVIARRAVDQILHGHDPFPALAIDRHWTMLAHNRAVKALLDGVAPALLEPPVNVLRLSLHPDGLAPRILNLGEWKAHLLDRLGGQVAASGDPVLAALLTELAGYPAPEAPEAVANYGRIFVPMLLEADGTQLSFFSTTTVFGTPTDVTLSEIAIEAFFPANEATGEMLQAMALEIGAGGATR